VSLDEASRIVIALDRARLQAGRELRGLSQTALAREAGITAAAVSQFENGHSRPTPSTLLKVSHALELPLAYFARRPGSTAGEAPAAFFRSLRSTSAAERRRATALVGLVHELVHAVEQHVALPPADAPGTAPANDDDDVERAASGAREHFGLDPHAPVPDVVRALERHGIVTARFRVDGHQMDAFSVDYRDRPIVVLGADKGHRDRSRFDAAHELGHLVLHGPEHAGTKEAENQAHRFAAAFLMPADAIRDELPRRADWEQLGQLKRKWEVSLAALLKRAQTLGKMDPTAYTQAMKTMSARGWRKREPVDLGPAEKPVLLAKALEVAAAHGVTLDALAAEHGLPLHDLRKVLQHSLDPRPRVEL
jgi:Zn-dependent peptidase ImmA (M78 family)/transcriptional regulator with XRE-family HTH domain